MAEYNLLHRYPKPKQNIQARAEKKTDKVIWVARQYGKEYFDGERDYGYGGYKYDGRWVPIAEDIIEHFKLKSGMRILDVGCAKGFLVKDLMLVCPGLEAFGLDVSKYALQHCEPEVVGRLHLGSADDLPFPDNSFDAVVSINTIHNLPREQCKIALMEIERLAPGKSYVQVDSYFTEQQRNTFLDWVLTAKFHDYPDGWRKLFAEANFTGDYYWTFAG